MSTPTEPARSSLAAQRLWLVGLAAAFTVAGIGFLTGTRPPPEPVRPEVRMAPAQGAAMPTYAGLRELKRGPYAQQYEAALAPLHDRLPGLNEPVVQTDEDRERALEARASRRAYAGAPPTIPHAVDQQSLPACLACHAQGLVIAGKTAPRMSHAVHASCTQCHVVDADPRPLQEPVPVLPNTFAGLKSWGRGERAWTGAPPTMPHPTHMRTDCMSCHGVGGRPGLRTPHPYRQSCTQCHPPSALLDQRLSTEPAPVSGGMP